MKYLLLALCLGSCAAQVHHTAVRVPDGDTEMLVGTASLDSLTNPPFANWYGANMEEYQVNEAAAPELEKLLDGVAIKLFMGTWCGDSKREVPRFVRILQAADYPEDKVEVIMMNREKVTPQNYEKGYGIINVPTFIFFRNGEELGRIVEYPVESLEADMLKILRGEPYRHAYDWD